MTECITQKVLGAGTNDMTGFSGVRCLNAVVWEVEDLCHTVPLDGPIAVVMGKHLCATAVTETLQVVFFPTFYLYML